MTASCSSTVMPSSTHGKVIMAISASSSDGNGAAVGSGTAVGAGAWPSALESGWTRVK